MTIRQRVKRVLKGYSSKRYNSKLKTKIDYTIKADPRIFC